MKLTLTRKRGRGKRRDPAVLRKHTHDQLVKLWKECVKSFVIETSRYMAIDTGMSMASLLPLAAKVRLASTIRATISGASAGPRTGYTDMNFTYHRNQRKSIAHGRRLGDKAYQLRFGSPSNPALVFEFDIVVLQHHLHESLANYRRSKDWQSLERGREAFLATWNELLPVYINPAEINDWLITGVWKSAR
jgi:hypothetical protein